MKLNRDDLNFALVCAKSYYYDSLNSDYPNKYDQKNAELFSDLEQAENNDTLEIEGYERVQWTKFDSCKLDTYPTKLTPILAFGFPNPDNNLMPEFFVCQLSVMCDFISKESYDAKVLFWRPLTKPPIETE